MSIQFIPLGLPFSSSFAVSSSVALAATNVPTTASLAGFAINLLGTAGDAFLEINAAPTLVVVPV